jgi:ABC-type glycerol-3-phosphate transport system substrate-binding protein
MTSLTKILLAASFVAGIPVQGATEINYWLWDSNQQPSYQACADAFEKESPDIRIKITQEEAWKWVKFLASPEAQKIVASYGIVFPAVPEAAEISEKQMASKGVDVSAFVDEAKTPGGTFFLPISEHSSDVVRILRANFDSIFLNGEDPASKLEASNGEINALFR